MSKTKPQYNFSEIDPKDIPYNPAQKAQLKEHEDNIKNNTGLYMKYKYAQLLEGGWGQPPSPEDFIRAESVYLDDLEYVGSVRALAKMYENGLLGSGRHKDAVAVLTKYYSENRKLSADKVATEVANFFEENRAALQSKKELGEKISKEREEAAAIRKARDERLKSSRTQSTQGKIAPSNITGGGEFTVYMSSQPATSLTLGSYDMDWSKLPQGTPEETAKKAIQQGAEQKFIIVPASQKVPEQTTPLLADKNKNVAVQGTASSSAASPEPVTLNVNASDAALIAKVYSILQNPPVLNRRYKNFLAEEKSVAEKQPGFQSILAVREPDGGVTMVDRVRIDRERKQMGKEPLLLT